MQKERLELLADYPDVIPPETFDINNWRCGTVACAIGHAAHLFRNQGLTLVESDYESERMKFHPEYDGDSGWSAVTEFFGLDSSEDAYDLFFIDGYNFRMDVTAKEVADKIRSFISENSP